MKRIHRMPFGAELHADGTAFRLWAPGTARVELCVDDSPPLAMNAHDDGWHEAFVASARAGARYAFRLPDGLRVPDPASRANPDGVHAPSCVVDALAYDWRDGAWRGRPWHEAVLYELHVGTFTPEGTFAAAAQRLRGLAELGVTVVELMPVAAFPGTRNWGYDGVLPFAPAAAYGSPDDLKRFVDDAHALGLMVMLDVVYNHFGPEGNYLHTYAPAFFNPRHKTLWGAGINFDGDQCANVRAYFVHNALYWLEEFRFDGLRLDAVHAIADDTVPSIGEEIALTVRSHFGATREVHLVLENDRNEARLLRRDAEGRPQLATAQWNDDFHHALHVLATGESDGYYVDFATRPLHAFGRALAEGFIYQDDVSVFRNCARRGERCGHLPPSAFVSFAQNHDQVGNRALGERLVQLADEPLLRALTACMLLAPAPPLLFMGEEFGATTPFLFFCDFGPELAAAVSRGRRAEFARFARFGDLQAQRAIPDPNDRATFLRSRIDWAQARSPQGAAWLALYRRCLDHRRRAIAPLAAKLRCAGTHRVDDGLLRVTWTARDGEQLHLVANLSRRSVRNVALPDGERFAPCDDGDASGEPGTLGSHTVLSIFVPAAKRSRNVPPGDGDLIARAALPPLRDDRA
jgi:maltooligosyltrehalose trehalohydrolase